MVVVLVFGDGDGGIAHLYGMVLNSVGGKHREAVVIRKLQIVLAPHTFLEYYDINSYNALGGRRRDKIIKSI